MSHLRRYLNVQTAPIVIGIGGFSVVTFATFLLSTYRIIIPVAVGDMFKAGAIFGFVAMVIAFVAITGARIKRLPGLARLLGTPGRGEEALCQLVRMRGEAVPILTESLRSPWAETGHGRDAWDGYQAHRLAVEALAELGMPECVPPLIEALNHRDSRVRAAAAALGAIGDVRAVPALVRLLGNQAHVLIDLTIRQAARDKVIEALAALGHGELPSGFARVIQGDHDALDVLRRHRHEFAEAFLQVAENHARDEQALHAVWAIGELGAAELLPKLRLGLKLASALDRVADVPGELKAAVADAIAKLEARESLPRPAEYVPTTDTLPRAASEDPTPSIETLPRATVPMSEPQQEQRVTEARD